MTTQASALGWRRAVWRKTLLVLGIQPAGEAPAPALAIGVDGADRQTSDTDETYKLLSEDGPPGWLARFVNREVGLARYRRLEEWSWRSRTTDVLNLAWLLRARQEEATIRSERAWAVGAALTLLGGVVALVGVVGTIAAWFRITGFVGTDEKGLYRIPDHLWIVVIATSGAVVLVGAAAGMLFSVAAQFHERSGAYASAADRARQHEAALRVALIKPGPDGPDGADGQKLEKLMTEILSPAAAAPSQGQKSPDASPLSVPAEVLNTIVAAVKPLTEVLKAKGG
jgi:hypothetical protein